MSEPNEILVSTPVPPSKQGWQIYAALALGSLGTLMGGTALVLTLVQAPDHEKKIEPILQKLATKLASSENMLQSQIKLLSETNQREIAAQAEIQNQLRNQVARLPEALADMSARLASLEMNETKPDANGDTDARLGALTADLQALALQAQNAQAQSNMPVNENVKAEKLSAEKQADFWRDRFALENFAAALRAGRPAEAEFGALSAALQEAVPAEIKEGLRNGLGSKAELTRAFKLALPELLRPQKQDDTAPWHEKWLQDLQALVTVRQIEGLSAEDPQSLVARIEMAQEREDWSEALALIVEQASSEQAAELQWREALSLRVEMEAMLKSLQTLLLEIHFSAPKDAAAEKQAAPDANSNEPATLPATLPAQP